MKMKINRNKDLSHIRDIEDLRKEITRVKVDLKIQEQQLEERIKRFPAEALKTSAGAVFPFVINNAIASRTFGIVKNVTGLFFGGAKSKGSAGQKIFAAAKQLGMVSAIKAGYSLLKKRRSKKQEVHKKERVQSEFK